MNKTWSDRADRDLFLAILMVKSVGVVSGAEWSQIGALMRGQGHGFTNEGCRQHFQGMRRKSARKETVVKPPDAGSRDPHHDPIMRRPGPGRRKSQKPASVDPQQPLAAQDSSADQMQQAQLQPPEEQAQQQQQPIMINQSLMTPRSLSQSLPQSMAHIHHAQQHAAMLAHVQQQQQQQQQQQSLFQHYQMHDPSLVSMTGSLPVDVGSAATDAVANGIGATSNDTDIDALDVSVSLAPSPPTDPALAVAVGVSVDDSPSLQTISNAHHQHLESDAAAIGHDTPVANPGQEGHPQTQTHPHLDAVPIDPAGPQQALVDDGTDDGPPTKRQRIDVDVDVNVGVDVGVGAPDDTPGLNGVTSTEDLIATHLQNNVVDVVSGVDVGVGMGVGVDVGDQDPTQHASLSDDDAAAAAVLALQEASAPGTGVEGYETT
ncbi:hypothetical protein BROUX41_000318 [Berkeleyomyces rouxiae]